MGEESVSWEPEEGSVSNRHLVMSITCCSKSRLLGCPFGKSPVSSLEGLHAELGVRNERARQGQVQTVLQRTLATGHRGGQRQREDRAAAGVAHSWTTWFAT